jgi:predicted MFS family arabinose efflux permease
MTTTPEPAPVGRSERAVVGLVAAVQFVNIVDFMMVMPLGPDFAGALGVSMHHIGVVGGAYTLAAGLVGVLVSPMLDRMDRRRALAICMAGLAVGTALGGAAIDLSTLVGARVVAGAFGGPATSVALAIVSDVVPAARRGRAMASVMTAFSVASIAGVPAGLALAGMWGWRAPFFLVAASGAVITTLAVRWLPPLVAHLDVQGARPDVAALLRLPAAWAGLAATAFVTMSGFLVIPNLSAFIQFNLVWPREDLPYLYMAGGACTFVALRAFGWFADRVGAIPLNLVGTVAFAGVGLLWFGFSPPPMPVWALFPAMMLAMSARNVAHQSVISRVAPPRERAAFQSLNSAVQHGAAATAAFVGAAMLGTAESGALVGMPGLALLALLFGVAVPGLLAFCLRRAG